MGRRQDGEPRRARLRRAPDPPAPLQLPLADDLRSRIREAERFVVPMERRAGSRPDPIELDVRRWWGWFTGPGPAA
ncbi:MAG TPA: hypothetical protein VKG45_12430 [Actinomycetes bacterium]|nr:hypothetical protein [Actinomycetes bacterium]